MRDSLSWLCGTKPDRKMGPMLIRVLALWGPRHRGSTSAEANAGRDGEVTPLRVPAEASPSHLPISSHSSARGTASRHAKSLRWVWAGDKRSQADKQLICCKLLLLLRSEEDSLGAGGGLQNTSKLSIFSESGGVKESCGSLQIFPSLSTQQCPYKGKMCYQSFLLMWMPTWNCRKSSWSHQEKKSWCVAKALRWNYAT